MKKIAFLFVCVLVSSLTFAGGPGDNPKKNSSSMAVVKRDESSFNLIYKSELEASVNVQIFNEDKALVFTEMISKSNGFVRPYNFASLSEGDYTIKLDNGANSLSETVHYSTVSHEKQAQLIQMRNGKYLLTVPGQGQDVISIEVLNAIGEKVYSENIAVEGNFAKVFDLRMMNGDFAFEIRDQHGASKTLWKP